MRALQGSVGLLLIAATFVALASPVSATSCEGEFGDFSTEPAGIKVGVSGGGDPGVCFGPDSFVVHDYKDPAGVGYAPGVDRCSDTTGTCPESVSPNGVYLLFMPGGNVELCVVLLGEDSCAEEG